MKTTALGTTKFFYFVTAVASCGYGLRASDASAATEVLIIDEGADLDHPGLRRFQNPNMVEINGSNGVDDDRNGFVDDYMGWNTVSNDPYFMPPKIKAFFLANREKIQPLFEVLGAAMDGDAAAKAKLKADRASLLLGTKLLNLSHGTHVSGIVATQSHGAARIRSLNVFSKSTNSVTGADTSSGVAPTPASLLNAQLMGHFFGLTSSQSLGIGVRSASIGGETKSVFDDDSQINEFIVKQKNESVTNSDLISRYVRASHAKVANISLGMSMINIQSAAESIWKADCQRTGIDPTGPRTSAQQANFDRLIGGVFGAYEATWSKVFTDNANVLFVVAAGNDGDGDKVSNPGDNEAHPVLPANLSARFRNVITVAATDDRGAIMDFSNHGARFVNVGAPGKSIVSFAPANMSVSMSGTSMAAPYVTGVATYLRDLAPNLNAAQIREALESTVRRTASLEGKISSGGMIDVEAAAAAVQSSPLMSAINAATSRVGRLGRAIGVGPAAPTDRTTAGEVAPTSDFERAIIHSIN